jgi:hypothetical protein
MRALFLALLCLFGGVVAVAKEKPAVRYSIPLPAKPDFSALEWLLGDWTGKTTDRGAPREIRWSVALDLDKQVMIVRSEMTTAATASQPAWKESWLGILSPGGPRSGFVLRTFSSTGFIVLYHVTIDRGEVSLTQEGGEQPPPGWLFRRVLDRTGVDEFTETVQAAPPGKPFFDYYTAKLTRVSPAAKPPEKPATPANPAQ